MALAAANLVSLTTSCNDGQGIDQAADFFFVSRAAARCVARPRLIHSKWSGARRCRSRALHTTTSRLSTKPEGKKATPPQTLGCDSWSSRSSSAEPLQSVRNSDQVPDPRPPVVDPLLDLRLEDEDPDAAAIWLFHEALVEAGLIDELFDHFSSTRKIKGCIPRGRPGSSTLGRGVGAKSSATRRTPTTPSRLPETRGIWEKKFCEDHQKEQRSQLDPEARPELLWLPEPRRRGRVAQDDPQWVPTTPRRTIARSWTTVSIQADAGGPGVRPTAPTRSARWRPGWRLQGPEEPHPSAVWRAIMPLSREQDGRTRFAGGARPRRARVRPRGEARSGRGMRAHHRHGSGEVRSGSWTTLRTYAD